MHWLVNFNLKDRGRCLKPPEAYHFCTRKYPPCSCHFDETQRNLHHLPCFFNTSPTSFACKPKEQTKTKNWDNHLGP